MKFDNWQTQLRKGMLDIVVLNYLANGACHGYEMVQSLKSVAGLTIREGNIYPILSRLQSDGLVKVRKGVSSDGPPRKYFELTENGKEILFKMNEHWDSIIDSVEQIRKGKEDG